MSSNQDLFKKYLLSFLLIFMIPVSCIITTLFSIGYDIFSKELYDKEIVTIDISTNNLNHQLDECLLIGHHLTNKDQFKTFDLEKTPAEGVRLISTLFNYVVSDQFLSDVIVSFNDTDYVYTSKTSLSLDSFYEQYTAPDYSEQNLKSLFNDITTPTFINSLNYKDKNYFSLVVPLISSYKQTGFCVFLFEEESFYNLLMTPLNSNRNLYFLNALDLEDSLNAINLDHLPTLNKESFIRSLSMLNDNKHNFSINSDNYFLYGVKPSPNIDNLILLSVISHGDIFEPLNILNIIMLTSILGAVIFSLLCSYYVVRRNYAPISEINYSLTLLKQNYSKLQNEVNQSIPMKQYFFLNQLVNGNVNNMPDFIDNCTTLNIDLTSPYHGIVVAKSQMGPFTIDSTIHKTIASMQQVEINQIYLIQHIHSNTDILLMGTQSDITLSTLVLPQATLYFGSFSRRLSNLSTSYINARTISEFETTPKLSDSLQVLFQDYKTVSMQLNTFLQVKDFTKISELILQTMHSLESTSLPFSLQKVICIEIMMAFNNYIDKQDDPIPYDKLDLVSLFKVESFDALKEIVLEVSTEMLDLIVDYHHSRVPEPSLTLIRDFIKEHFYEESFSVEQVALQFSIPLSYFQEYFYKHHNETPLFYINRLRIEKAKELLNTTPYSLKIISAQVGFIHVSSFISTFKEFENCTPGQYRKKHYAS